MDRGTSTTEWLATTAGGSLSFHTTDPSRPDKASAKLCPPARTTSSTRSPSTSANATDWPSLPALASQRTFPSAPLIAITRPRTVIMITSGEPSPLRSSAARTPRGTSSLIATMPSGLNSPAVIAVKPARVPTRMKSPRRSLIKSGGVVAGLPASPERMTVPASSRISIRPLS